MRTHFFTPVHVITAIAVTLLFISCGKHDVNPDCYPQLCRIETVSGHDGDVEIMNVITYNSVGNPIRRTRSDLGTGRENESYRYDAQNRLTDQILYYDSDAYGEFFWEWHRFKYDAAGNISFDSTYLIGRIGDHPLPFELANTIITTTEFKYDHKHRIIEERAFIEGQPWFMKEYIYDGEQNLSKKIVSSGPQLEVKDTAHYASYDQKINYLNTHKIWQFFSRDYSLHNITQAVSYNKYGLPLKFRPGNKGRRTYFIDDIQYIDMDITYKCK